MAGRRVGDTTDVPREVRVIADLGPGDHLCCIYQTEAEHRTVLTPFLRQGLERNEKVLYVADTHAADVVTDYLRDDGIDPQPYLASGQLEVLGGQETYLRGGTFSPEGMVALLRSETERALSDGYSALRVTGETAWVHSGQVEPERVVEYEVLVNAFSPGSRCLAICQYDRRRVAPEVLLDVVRAHPYLAIGSDVCASPYYVPPGGFYGAGRPAAELAGWMHGMAERRRQEDLFRGEHLRLERILEATGAGTWESDLETGESFVNARWAEILGYTLDELGEIPEAWSRLVHPDDLARSEDLLERHYSGRLPEYACEIRMRHKDGHWVRIMTRGRVMIRSDDGTPQRMFGTHIDVTEQRKADEDLRSAQARLRGFADANVIGVSVNRADGEILEANDYYLDLIGYSREELERGEANWRVVTSSEWLAVDEAAIEALVERGVSAPYESEYLRRDGRRVDVLVSGSPLPDGDLFAEFTLDITERKAAEAALSQSEQRFRAVFEEALVGIALTDVPTGRFIEANDRYASIVGLTREGLATATWMEVTHPDDLGPDLDNLVRLRAGDIASYRMEKRYLRPDGEIVWVDMSVRALRAGDPEHPLALTIVEDITTRKASEEALRESEANLREAQRVGRTGSWRWDARTDESTWSEQTHWVYGMDPAGPATTMTTLASLFTAQAVEHATAAVARAVQDGEPYEFEHDFVRPDGTHGWALLRGVPERGPDGAVFAIHGTVTDITERKAAEEQMRSINEQLERRVLERTAKLEEANRELATFNYSASHDLRAPLRAINGYASLLRRRHGDSLDAESRRYLGQIETASERMGILIEELLDYSRLGREGVRSEPVPLEPLVGELRTVFGERLAETGGRLDLAGPHAVPRCDPALLERILANLVENALVYRRADVVPTVTITAGRQGATVVVAVTDNGIGIPDAHREKIFALFTRLHGEDEYPGTGIGLSIVRKAASLMGTEVTVESVEGEGSTFSLVLPAAPG